jgi:hypothetical protein
MVILSGLFKIPRKIQFLQKPWDYQPFYKLLHTHSNYNFYSRQPQIKNSLRKHQISSSSQDTSKTSPFTIKSKNSNLRGDFWFRTNEKYFVIFEIFLQFSSFLLEHLPLQAHMDFYFS